MPFGDMALVHLGPLLLRVHCILCTVRVGTGTLPAMAFRVLGVLHWVLGARVPFPPWRCCERPLPTF